MGNHDTPEEPKSEWTRLGGVTNREAELCSQHWGGGMPRQGIQNCFLVPEPKQLKYAENAEPSWNGTAQLQVQRFCAQMCAGGPVRAQLMSPVLTQPVGGREQKSSHVPLSATCSSSHLPLP